MSTYSCLRQSIQEQERPDLQSPEHRMLTAAVYHAVKDALSGERHIRREALAWLEGTQAGSQYAEWSFAGVAEILELSDRTCRKIVEFAKNPKNARVFFRLVEAL